MLHNKTPECKVPSAFYEATSQTFLNGMQGINDEYTAYVFVLKRLLQSSRRNSHGLTRSERIVKIEPYRSRVTKNTAREGSGNPSGRKHRAAPSDKQNKSSAGSKRGRSLLLIARFVLRRAFN